MKVIRMLACYFAISFAQAEVVCVLREDFREHEAHIPFTTHDLVNRAHMRFETVGKEGTRLKLSHHPEVKDPHYLYFGPAKAPTGALFHFSTPIDCSHKEAKIVISTRHTGGAKAYVMVKSNGQWWMSSSSPTGQGSKLTDPFDVTEYRLSDLKLRPFNVHTSQDLEQEERKLSFKTIEGIGFYSMHRGGSIVDGKKKSTPRVDWFEIHGVEQQLPYVRKTPERPNFFERNTPFFSSSFMIDKNHSLTRGLIVRLENDHWLGFDMEKMLPSCVWKNDGDPLSLDSMAACSYPNIVARAKAVPQVLGEVLMKTTTGRVENDEVERLFSSVAIRGEDTVISYTLSKVACEEMWKFDTEKTACIRAIRVKAHSGPLVFALDARALNKSKERFTEGSLRNLKVLGLDEESYTLRSSAKDGTQIVLHACEKEVDFNIVFSENEQKTTLVKIPSVGHTAQDRFPMWIEAQENIEVSEQGGYTIKHLSLLEDNPYNRAIRPMDIAFTSTGEAYVCTFDGDIWVVRGLDERKARWKRFAYGLYEVTNIEIDKDDSIYVLARDQIVELVDSNKDGCADGYICVNNTFNQTLHTRDFSLSMEIDDDGNFLIAKGGITHGKEDLQHRGAILKVIKKTGEVEIVANGMRMPYVGIDRKGDIFASDQQGHYIPSSPIYKVKAGESYGFELTNTMKKPIADALFWFPYLKNRSAAGFVQLAGKHYAAYEELLCHISWNGCIFGVFDDKEQPFAWRFPFSLNFSSLNGKMHPVSHYLYLTGVGISGYKPQTEKRMGLAVVIPPKAPLIPKKMEVVTSGIEVTFNKKISLKREPKIFLSSWDVKRSKQYGSGHFNWLDKPGENPIEVKKVSLKNEGKTLKLVTDRLFNCSILELKIYLGDGEVIELFTTIRGLGAYDATKSTVNFSKLQANLKPGNTQRGRQVYRQKACTSCHSLDGQSLTGPPLNGIGKKLSKLEIRESILSPASVVAKGYQNSMPSFAGVLSEQEVTDLVEFLSNMR